MITTLIVIFMVSGLILWEHFHGGVILHHLFGDKNMPKISNWWGLLSIPVVTWISVSIIQKRQQKNHEEKSTSKLDIYGFIGSFLFGVAMTILFYNESSLTGNLLLLTFALALFIPMYKPEYYLGFILSMVYGFGGILPVLFGLILISIYAIEYFLIRKSFLFILNKIRRGE